MALNLFKPGKNTERFVNINYMDMILFDREIICIGYSKKGKNHERLLYEEYAEAMLYGITKNRAG